MIASSGTDADERQLVFDCDRRNECLRSVTARHAQTVGTAGNCVARELFEVKPRFQHDGLDAEFSCLVEKPELFDFAATRLRIAQQHRMLGRAARPHAYVDRAL